VEWRRRIAAVRGPAAGRPTVLCVARLYPRKRVDDLLVAADLLRQRIPRVQVRIVGDGPEGPKIRTLHRRLGLDDTVVLLGHVERNVLALEYSRADCFCLPTVQEGFGLVFAEAMAAGLPVVTTPSGGPEALARDSRGGAVLSGFTAEELADRVRALLDDPARLAYMRRKGREYVAREHSPERLQTLLGEALC